MKGAALDSVNRDTLRNSRAYSNLTIINPSINRFSLPRAAPAKTRRIQIFTASRQSLGLNGLDIPAGRSDGLFRATIVSYTNPHDLKDLTRSVQLFLSRNLCLLFRKSWPQSTSCLPVNLVTYFGTVTTVSKALACSKLATVARRTSKLDSWPRGIQ